MCRISYVLVVLFIALAQLAWAEENSALLDAREELAYEEMMSPNMEGSSPIANLHFLPGASASAATHSFSGVLSIPESVMITEPKAIEPKRFKGKSNQLFPDVQISFFTVDDRLVPVERGLLEGRSGKSPWQMLASPGRIWSEKGDQGYSRASFPFALTNKYENETYNGVATFLFNDSGVSYMRYQIVQQLTPYLVKSWFVACGHVKASCTPRKLDGIKKLKKDFARELKGRTPMRNWSELEKKYGSTKLAGFDAWTRPEWVITSGLIVDGVIYAKPAQTPYGDYPYPYEMRHGMWSVTKSMLGMVSTLRMAQKYGDEIFDYKIKDYLNVTAEHDGWEEVTIGDALNMATGAGGTGTMKIDPNDMMDGYFADLELYNGWYLAPSAQEKLTELFKGGNYPWGPGEHARYRDRDYFVLSATLQSLLQKKEGPDVSLWAMMKEEVYGPIGIRHMTAVASFEPDGRPGVLHMGYGLYMTLDDIAKVSGLLQNGGKHKGKQLLSAAKLAEALYETPVRGLPTGSSNKYGLNSYHMSIWHMPLKNEQGVEFTIPEMHGWGGILVALMPNGMTGFKIGNAGTQSLSMSEVANRLRPFERKEARH